MTTFKWLPPWFSPQPSFPCLQQKPIAPEMPPVYPSASSMTTRSFWSYPSTRPAPTTSY